MNTKYKVAVGTIGCFTLLVCFQNCGNFSSSVLQGAFFEMPEELESPSGDMSSNADRSVNANSLVTSTHNSALVTVDMSDYSKLFIKYGTDRATLTEETDRESSFKYKTHKQRLVGLIPDTTYYYQIVAENSDGDDCCEDVHSFKTLPTPPTVALNEGDCVSGATDRDMYWREKGYDCTWSATPEESEVGMDGRTYIHGSKWTNGVTLKGYTVINGAKIDVTAAPDSGRSPALKVELPRGTSGNDNRPAILIWGHQLGANPQDKKIVFSHEMWYPCPDGVNQEEPRQYVGFGPMWGSDDKLITPGGSSRPDPNRGWTFRVPVARHTFNGTPEGSGNYFLYTYLPDVPDDRPHGFSYGVTAKPACDRWDLVELEVQPNRPASSRNAIVSTYINGIRAQHTTNIRIREHEDVHARGFGIFVGRGNPDVPAVMYYRNQKIYTSDY